MPVRIPAPANQKRQWRPRMWHGSHAFAWWRMLAKNGLSIHPKYYGISLVTTVTTAIHATLRMAQQASGASEAARTPLAHDPLFISNHPTGLRMQLMGISPEMGEPKEKTKRSDGRGGREKL